LSCILKDLRDAVVAARASARLVGTKQPLTTAVRVYIASLKCLKVIAQFVDEIMLDYWCNEGEG